MFQCASSKVSEIEEALRWTGRDTATSVSATLVLAAISSGTEDVWLIVNYHTPWIKNSVGGIGLVSVPRCTSALISYSLLILGLRNQKFEIHGEKIVFYKYFFIWACLINCVCFSPELNLLIDNSFFFKKPRDLKLFAEFVWNSKYRCIKLIHNIRMIFACFQLFR